MKKTYVLKDSESAPSFSINYKNELNAEQYQVVSMAEGPCLVLAGAGSGKTRTLIFRVAYLLEKGFHPENILLVTFTNKAASEMKNRVEMLLGAKAHGLWCGTFHHIGNRLLRIYGPSIGQSADFSILDEEDSCDLIKSCLEPARFKASGIKFPKPQIIRSIISFAINARKGIAEVIQSRYPYLLEFSGEIQRIASAYEAKKRKSNNMDYDDLLVRWLELLDPASSAAEKIKSKFLYCLVDEYQDTNRLQHEVVNRLSTEHGNILVVGDDAQSIYSFRAAEIKNILDFPELHKKCSVFKLETNYRSARPILDLANDIIRHNSFQFPKTLRSHHGSGPLPQLVRVKDSRQEARFIVQRVRELQENGASLSHMAVLFRAHFQSAELEMELIKQGIPYVVRGGIRFFEQAHIKDVLAFLRLLVNPLDEIAWTRALTLQPGIGQGYAAKIFQSVEAQGASLEKVVGHAFGEHLPPRVKQGLYSFKQFLKPLLKEDLKGRPDMLIEEILERGYTQYVLMNFDNGKDRVEDLKELVNFAHTYRSLKSFLADTTLRENFKGESALDSDLRQSDAHDEELVLSTIHQAKGLEWDSVFIIRLSEGQFPHAKSMESEEEIEEERRLFYVAVTRAKKDLFLMHPMMRFDYNEGMIITRSSIFLSELSSRLYDEIDVEENTEEDVIYVD